MKKEFVSVFFAYVVRGDNGELGTPGQRTGRRRRTRQCVGQMVHPRARRNGAHSLQQRSSGCSPSSPFVQLATFAAGGTYTETNSVLNFNTASSLGFNGSDGHGAWKAQGVRHYMLTFRKLLYTGAGEYAGNADLNENVTVGGNTISGTFTVKFSLPNATQPCASGQLSGERISVQ